MVRFVPRDFLVPEAGPFGLSSQAEEWITHHVEEKERQYYRVEDLNEINTEKE